MKVKINELPNSEIEDSMCNIDGLKLDPNIYFSKKRDRKPLSEKAFSIDETGSTRLNNSFYSDENIYLSRNHENP